MKYQHSSVDTAVLNQSTRCKTASYTVGTGSFPGYSGLRGVDHSPPSSAEFKERVELHLYSHGPSWPILGLSLPLPLLEVQTSPCVIL